MTQAMEHRAHNELTFEISNLIAKFGRRRALVAVLMSFRKGKGRPPDATLHLRNHLRRDIGLPELAEPSPRHRDIKV